MHALSTTSRPRRAACMLAVLAGFCASTHAQEAPRPSDQPWRELIGTDLSRTQVQLVALRDDGELVARERDGAGVRRARGEVLALLPLSDTDALLVAPTSSLLLLTNGASLPGQLEGVVSSTPAEGETRGEPRIRWATPTLGSVESSLDTISLLWLADRSLSHATAARLRADTEDIVLLANGDRREGFVELETDAAGEAQVRIEHAGQSSTVALRLVHALAPANPATPALGSWIWLDDASVVGISRASMLAGKPMELTWAWPGASQPAPTTISIAPVRMRGLIFDRARLRGLSECELVSEASDPQRRYTPPAVVRSQPGTPTIPGTVDIELPGPMLVRVKLPAGATLIDGLLELPEQCRTFGSVRVTLSQGGRELSQVRLNSATPTASFRAVLTGDGPLEILVDDAGDGAIQDTVIVRRTLIAVQP